MKKIQKQIAKEKQRVDDKKAQKATEKAERKLGKLKNCRFQIYRRNFF
jgi:hypothetical protein